MQGLLSPTQTAKSYNPGVSHSFLYSSDLKPQKSSHSDFFSREQMQTPTSHLKNW